MVASKISPSIRRAIVASFRPPADYGQHTPGTIYQGGYGHYGYPHLTRPQLVTALNAGWIVPAQTAPDALRHEWTVTEAGLAAAGLGEPEGPLSPPAPGHYSAAELVDALREQRPLDPPAAPALPYVCQPGQVGQVHQLSYQHPISTGYRPVAREVVESGTCRCGLAVVKFLPEGQAPVNSRVRLFPAERLADVVAGLAPEPFGPMPVEPWTGPVGDDLVVVESDAGDLVELPRQVADQFYLGQGYHLWAEGPATEPAAPAVAEAGADDPWAGATLITIDPTDLPAVVFTLDGDPCTYERPFLPDLDPAHVVAVTLHEMGIDVDRLADWHVQVPAAEAVDGYAELYPGRKPIDHPGMNDAPAAADQLRDVRYQGPAEPVICAAFALCTNEATEWCEHPVIGRYPACARCSEKLARIRNSA